MREKILELLENNSKLSVEEIATLLGIDKEIVSKEILDMENSFVVLIDS